MAAFCYNLFIFLSISMIAKINVFYFNNKKTTL